MTGERVERRLAAVLAADVAGYSRLMGRDEEHTLANLKSFRKALVDPAIATHRGRIVKTSGDGMLVEFASAVDAARCSVEVQHGMNPLDQIAIPFTLFGMAAASFLLGRRSFCARVRLRGADRESLVGHARLRWTEDGPNSDAQ